MVRPSVPDPPELNERLWNVFGSYDLGFDVGANCGQSIAHIQCLCSRIVCFEPNIESYSYLVAMIGSSNSSISASATAVSRHDGFIDLAQLGGEQQATGQLVTPGTQGMEWSPADWSGTDVADYPCSTLDTLMEFYGQPGFIKIDTEGHELSVLTGAPLLLSRRATDFLVEIHSPDNYIGCRSLLEKAGYEVTVVRHPNYPEGSAMWHQHFWIQALA